MGCLRWILRLQHKSSPPGPEAMPTSEQDAAQTSPDPAALRLRRKQTEQPVKHPGKTHRTVDEVCFSGAAGCVLAGLQDGSAAACLQATGNTAAASTVTKHAGRMFGSICLSNLAIRNGLLMHALNEEIPCDNTVRFHDALAALPRCELFSVNQLGLEQAIHTQSAKAAAAKPEASKPANILDLSDLDFAAKRFFTALSTYTSPCKTDFWKVSKENGVSIAVAGKTAWFNLRQCMFGRKRKRDAELAEFGGPGVLNKFGDKKGWTALLDHIEEKKAGKRSQDNKTLLLRYSKEGDAWLTEERKVPQSVQNQYISLPEL